MYFRTDVANLLIRAPIMRRTRFQRVSRSQAAYSAADSAPISAADAFDQLCDATPHGARAVSPIPLRPLPDTAISPATATFRIYTTAQFT